MVEETRQHSVIVGSTQEVGPHGVMGTQQNGPQNVPVQLDNSHQREVERQPVTPTEPLGEFTAQQAGLVCEMCAATFPNQCLLAEHRVTHAQLICHVCGKRFIR